MSLSPNEPKTLSSLLEKLGEHVIQAETRASNLGTTFVMLKSKSTGRILCQFDIDCAFDADGRGFKNDL